MNNNIYLIGENKLTIELLENELTKKGYRVSCGNFSDVIQGGKTKKRPPDIIFWDNDLIKFRHDEIFNFLHHSKQVFRSIFVISSHSLAILGLGLIKGIEGFVHKSGGIRDLEKCIAVLLRGEKYISPILAGTFNTEGTESNKLGVLKASLTKQERKVLELVKARNTSKEIAEILNISCKTVENHRHNMCRKLGLRGRNRLFEFANLYL